MFITILQFTLVYRSEMQIEEVKLFSLSFPLQTSCLWTLRCLAVLRQLSTEKDEATKNTIFSLMEKGWFLLKLLELIKYIGNYY